MKHQAVSSRVENHFLLVTILLRGLFFRGRILAANNSTLISGSTHTRLHLKSNKERQWRECEEDSPDPPNSAGTAASPWSFVHFAPAFVRELVTVDRCWECPVPKWVLMPPAAFRTVFRSIKVNWTQALKDAQYSSSDNKLC